MGSKQNESNKQTKKFRGKEVDTVTQRVHKQEKTYNKIK